MPIVTPDEFKTLLYSMVEVFFLAGFAGLIVASLCLSLLRFFGDWLMNTKPVKAHFQRLYSARFEARYAARMARFKRPV